jgi:hypothetical protein
MCASVAGSFVAFAVEKTQIRTYKHSDAIADNPSTTVDTKI